MGDTSGCYVCLSDLHLGAAYSVLSNVTELERRQLGASPSACLERLAESFEKYLPRVFEHKPKLLLLGDCLDFDFGTAGDAARGFQTLVGALFSSERRCAFDPTEIVVVPGNHDHCLWQFEKDALLVDAVKYPGNARTQSTELFAARGVRSRLLNELIADLPVRPEITLHYPNFGLRDAVTGTGRQVILHHGHFTESMYRVISSLHALIGGRGPATVETLEQDNGGWIDFFWSSLGASKVGRDNAVLLYDVMQDPAAAHQFAHKLADRIVEYLGAHYAVNGERRVVAQMSLHKLVLTVLNATLGRAFETERQASQQLLTHSGREDLRWYLAEPLRGEIDRHGCSASDGSRATTFIFGHTHKPFEAQMSVDGYGAPVDVYNTGGWVVDSPDPTSLQGAAALLIDSNLEVASLRLFPGSVRAQAVEGDSGNALLKRMRAALDGECGWQAFGASVTEALTERARDKRRRFFDPNSMTGLGS